MRRSGSRGSRGNFGYSFGYWLRRLINSFDGRKQTMARAYNITTPAGRDRIKREQDQLDTPRRKPYFERIRTNHFVGWRYMTKGTEGSWSAKVTSGADEQSYPLGSLSEVPELSLIHI